MPPSRFVFAPSGRLTQPKEVAEDPLMIVAGGKTTTV